MLASFKFSILSPSLSSLFPRLRVGVFSLLALFPTIEAQAQTTYERLPPGAGDWDVTTLDWTLGGPPIQWQNGADNRAFFGIPGGTINLTVPIIANRLTFADSGYVLNGPGTLTLAGTEAGVEVASGLSATLTMTIDGTTGLRKTGSGSLLLSGSNNYSGVTHLLQGTLVLGNSDALGTSTLLLESGTTLGVDGALGITNQVTLNGNINLQAGVTDFLEFLSNVDLATTSTLMFTETDGMVCFQEVISGVGGLSFQALPGVTASVMMCGSFTNTYTGLTTVGAGVTLELQKDPGFVAISGDLLIQAGGRVLSSFVDQQVHAGATVTVNGTWEFDTGGVPMVQQIAVLQGGSSGEILLDDLFSADNLELTVGAGNYAGVIREASGAAALSLVKSGAGTLILSGANTYTGGTQITGGTLQTASATALGTSLVTLTSGSLAPAGTTALQINALNWSGGTLGFTLNNPAEMLTIATNLTMTGSAGTIAFVAGSGFAPNVAFDLLSAANLNAAMLGSFSGNSLYELTPVFSLNGTKLVVTFVGTPYATGPLLQNIAPVGTPTWANFLVNGPVSTGPTSQSNTINSLIFSPGSSLTIFNNLTVTSGNFTVTGGSATVTGGKVITPGNFTKLGPGLLNILSNVLVIGPATVSAGSLLINGPFAALGGLTVSPNALLGGSGFILGNVINNGTLAPGNSPGTLAIAGNLTLGSSGTTQIEIQSLSVFDQILVSGLTTLGGTLDVVPFGGNELEFGQQFTFLISGSVTGEFANVRMPDGFRSRILLDDGDATLLVAPTSYTVVAENQNQTNVAAALDSYISATSGDRLAVSTALDELTESQYPAAFDQISPAFFQSLTSTTIEQYNSQGQFLQQRFSSVALGRQAGFAQYGIQAPVMTEKAGKAVTNAKDIVEATPDNKWGIWTLGNGIFARSSISSIPNYRSDSGGFLVGGDYRWNETFVTGVFGGYQGTASRYDNGGRTTINAARFGAYATYDSGNGFYANTVVGGGYSAYDVKRPIQFGSINRAASSAPGGAEFTSQLAAGYDWKVSGFTFGPVGNVQYTYAGVGGFGETGAESLNLRVGQQSANSLRSTLGARVAYTWVVNEKIAVIPELRMSWQHEFLMNPTGMSAALDGGSGPGFGYTTTAPARDSVFAGAGVTVQVGDLWNANFYYNADFGRSDYTSQMITGGLGINF